MIFLAFLALGIGLFWVMGYFLARREARRTREFVRRSRLLIQNERSVS